MREEYTFSKARLNPYLKPLMKAVPNSRDAASFLKQDAQSTEKARDFQSAAGILNAFADFDKVTKEESSFAEAMVKKHSQAH